MTSIEIEFETRLDRKESAEACLSTGVNAPSSRSLDQDQDLKTNNHSSPPTYGSFRSGDMLSLFLQVRREIARSALMNHDAKVGTIAVSC